MNAVQSPPELFVHTVPLRDHAGDLIDRLPEGTPLAWLNGNDGLVAWGRAARFEPEVAHEDSTPTDNSRIGQAARWFADLLDNARVEDEVGLPGTGAVTFGTFTFAPTSAGSALVVPRVLIGRRGDRTWLTIIGDEPGQHPEETLRTVTEPRPMGPLNWRPGSLTPQRWKDLIASTVTRIKDGEL